MITTDSNPIKIANPISSSVQLQNVLELKYFIPLFAGDPLQPSQGTPVGPWGPV